MNREQGSDATRMQAECDEPAGMLSLPYLRDAVPDWEVRRLFLQLRPARWLQLQTVSVATLRRNWQLCVKAFATREPVAHVEEMAIDRGDHVQKLRFYRPIGSKAGDRLPAIVWLHGGGFVFGDLYTAGATCRRLANETGCVVVAVQYRLAPEFPLETEIDDCVEGFRWVARNAASCGIDGNHILVGGDSAGGALAALVAQRCKQAGGPQPDAQILVYPATDLAMDHGTLPGQGEDSALLLEMFAALQAHISTRTNLGDPRLSPVRAEDVAGLPPAIFVTAGFDPLLDEGLRYARRLAASGVPVRLIHYPGQFHGFLSFDAVLHGASDAFGRVGRAVRSFLDTGTIATGAECVSLPAFLKFGWLWLRPSQRWNEALVICAVATEMGVRAVGQLFAPADLAPKPAER